MTLSHACQCSVSAKKILDFLHTERNTQHLGIHIDISRNYNYDMKKMEKDKKELNTHIHTLLGSITKFLPRLWANISMVKVQAFLPAVQRHFSNHIDSTWYCQNALFFLTAGLLQCTAHCNIDHDFTKMESGPASKECQDILMGQSTAPHNDDSELLSESGYPDDLVEELLQELVRFLPSGGKTQLENLTHADLTVWYKAKNKGDPLDLMLFGEEQKENEWLEIVENVIRTRKLRKRDEFMKRLLERVGSNV